MPDFLTKIKGKERSDIYIQVTNDDPLMIRSKLFEQNPSLYAFVPIFYMVWADAILTPSEILNIRELINKQAWLSKEEKDYLLGNLNPKSPPSPDTLKSWLATVKQLSGEMSDEMKKSLVGMGMKLAQINARNKDPETLEKARAPLTDIEEALGVISSEAAYHLRSATRRTITESQPTRKTFEVNELADLLDGSQKPVLEKIRTILSDKEFNYRDSENLNDYREHVLKSCRHLADQGFGAVGFPKAYGGEGDMEKYFAIMEGLSYHDLSTVIKFGVQFGLWGMSVYFLGTEKHHKKFLKAIGSLELPGCFAMTETGHGSNVKGLETTATYHHDEKTFSIHSPNEDAGKEYIGNAALHGQMATVFAKLMVDGSDYGVNAFIVPLRDKEGKVLPGITIKDCGRKMGLNGVDNGRIWFNEVTIPKENMLDRYASVDDQGQFQSPITSDNRRFFTMLGTLVGGRIGIPRSGLSATKSGLTIAIKYGDRRKQFGPENGMEVPILNYRTHQRRLMPLLANAYANHFALQYLTQRFLSRSDEDAQEIEALAAGLKAFCTWETTNALQECREALGGKGYLSENRIDRLKNDTDIYTTFEGDNTVLMQLVAKSRLSEFKKEFGEISFFGVLGYVAVQAKTSLTEMNPITIRNTDTEHLLDFDFHLGAFRYRERDILTSAARRIKKHIDAGMDSFDAFNQTQYHMLNVGFAYIERVVLEQFIEQINQVENPGIKGILTRLCQLFALSQIEKNKGWYLEHGYMDGVKTKAIRKMVNKLCWEVREEAVPLVEAFKIPESCLAAPIITQVS